MHFNQSLPNDYFMVIERDINYWKTVHNRRSFNNVSHRTILKERIQKNTNYFFELMRQLEHNNKNYHRYCHECDELFHNRSTDWYGGKDYAKPEEKIFRLLMLKPDLDIHITTHCQYTTPSKRKYYHSQKVFNLTDLTSIQNEIQQQTEFQLSKQYQRSLMTDSLRYDIMKRDGFACVLCGATKQDGAKLHVDHIRPVAKGGLTEPNNLRTLCEQCNLGKSDKYDPNGPN